MAFNWQTFKTRTITSIVFAAVMLTGLLWNQWSFFILFSIIHFGCWWEYFNLLEKIHQTSYQRYVRIGFMLIGFAIMLWFCGTKYEINGYGLKNNFSFPLSVAGFILLMFGVFQSKQIKLKVIGAAALALLYVSLSLGLMMGLRSSNSTIDIHLHDTMFIIAVEGFPIFIIASIWINDTMAYIVGSFIGKTPLSKISPKKTWEGTIGGIILCICIMGLLFPLIYSSNFSLVFSMVLMFVAAIVSIVGTFGDLLESKLKRMANVKDSGSFMPGFGGFLDRFDSMLLAIPAVWLFVYFFMR